MNLRYFLFILTVWLGASVLVSCEDESVTDESINPTRNQPFAFVKDFEDKIEYPLPNDITTTDWMSKLPNDEKVCNITIPGTHDSMTAMGFYNQLLQYIFNMTSISQVATLEEQLDRGIRFFDIRLVVAVDTLTHQKELFCAHGISEIGVQFRSVMESMVIPFLKKHNQEFVVMKLQQDNGIENQMPWLALAEEEFEYYNSKYPDLFYVWNGEMSPSVADVRGKVVLLCRSEYAVNTMPSAYVSWGDESADELEAEWARKHGGQRNPGYINYEAELNNCFITLDPNNLRMINSAKRILADDPESKLGNETLNKALAGCKPMHVQDYYKTDSIERMATKTEAVNKMLYVAKTTGNVWTINHCSAYTSVSPRGYCENAEKINMEVIQYLLKNPSGHYGIVVMDFAGYDNVSCVINGGTPYTSDYLFGKKPMGQSLTNLLIMSNFK